MRTGKLDPSNGNHRARPAAGASTQCAVAFNCVLSKQLPSAFFASVNRAYKLPPRPNTPSVYLAVIHCLAHTNEIVGNKLSGLPPTVPTPHPTDVLQPIIFTAVEQR